MAERQEKACITSSLLDFKTMGNLYMQQFFLWHIPLRNSWTPGTRASYPSSQYTLTSLCSWVSPSTSKHVSVASSSPSTHHGPSRPQSLLMEALQECFLETMSLFSGSRFASSSFSALSNSRCLENYLLSASSSRPTPKMSGATASPPILRWNRC